MGGLEFKAMEWWEKIHKLIRCIELWLTFGLEILLWKIISEQALTLLLGFDI